MKPKKRKSGFNPGFFFYPFLRAHLAPLLPVIILPPLTDRSYFSDPLSHPFFFDLDALAFLHAVRFFPNPEQHSLFCVSSRTICRNNHS
uniref:Uncharacterized protein n=1 Tax=Leptospira ellisii TaxID=2023197 RepID=A0A2N0BED2_9LEPT|nr:hypothetical protein CH379_00075 [Leptospira ellisii]